ncbi:cytochrome c peroxidase [uncultured Maribacter sp.]|uniref:cytochrome-c peroxidase n=1 Tax=uncultured Maribacter sp. TaxID=431308 RepID=UPI0030DD95FD|tara:strand:+ start:550 stop:2220 length:1671 start_codon:yes stop_codon:yes gene_type:complete
MKTVHNKWILLMILGVFLSCKHEETKPKLMITTNELSMFNDAIRNYYFVTLDSASHYMQQIDTTNSLSKNKELFLKSREWYKRVEPMLIAYDYENYVSMNAPNLLKVEIDDHQDVKIQNPKSYQVLEELLYSEDGFSNKELNFVLTYLKVRLPFVRKNHILIAQRDRHHLKMIRDAIINIVTKGITGFDSPMLTNSLNEAIYNYESIQKVLDIYKDAFYNPDLYSEWRTEITSSIAILKEGNFDKFDRYSFIKEHTNIQLELVLKTAKDWNVELSNSRSLDPNATSLFDKNFFNMKIFSMQRTPEITEERIALGKRLFNDKALSSTGTISCATCHIKEKAFTDAHTKALGSNGKELQRNSPTLTYAVYQRSLFYDGRADGLEDQIVGVTNNENEFHIDLEKLEEKIQSKIVYKVQFDSLYGGKITNMNVRNAIATYIRSLSSFDSKFDRNINGLEETMTNEEVDGFNLFMGKAACATCHFPPAFNGTVPPKYMESEFENLGVPKNASFENPVLDDDWGQYYPYEVEEKKHFFKTSTVRNVALTGPYMHNGVYATLE